MLPTFGPTWAFDLRSRTYINPMQGGGSGDQPEGFLFRHFSDYEVSRMQRYLDFLTMPSHFCTGVPSTSYCGFAFPGELKLTYTISVSGTVSFDWGHSWWGGSVVVLKNGAEIERLNSRGRQTSTFSAVAGDVLEIKEIDTSVINIHGLTITPTGRRQLTGRLIGHEAKFL